MIDALSLFFSPIEEKPDLLKKTLVGAAVVQAIHVLAMIMFSSTPPLIIGRFALNGVCLLLAARTRVPLFLPTAAAISATSYLFAFSASLLPVVVF